MLQLRRFRSLTQSLLGRNNKSIAGPSFRKLRNGALFHEHSLEIEVTDHCNLSCEGCNHLSPAMPKNMASPPQILSDLSLLKNYLRTKRLKLLGGEPTLHPNLLAIVEGVRHSGISDLITLITNGTLLSRISDDLLKLLDEVEISLYPASNLAEDELLAFKKRANRFSTSVDILYYHKFQHSFAFKGTQDTNLIQRIYNSCRKVQLWGCYASYMGHLFKCPQSIYLAMAVPALKRTPFADGLKIDGNRNMQNRIQEYLHSPVPLKACTYCLGNVGIVKKHRMISKSIWKDVYQVSTESVLDENLLLQAERDITIRSGCRSNNPFAADISAKTNVQSIVSRAQGR